MKSTKRKVVTNVLAVMPKEPKEFADVVNSLTEIKSPGKQEALMRKGNNTRNIRYWQDMSATVKESMKELHKAKSNPANAKRLAVCSVFAKYNKYRRGFAKHLKQHGISPRFFQKIASAESHKIKRKKRCCSW